MLVRELQIYFHEHNEVMSMYDDEVPNETTLRAMREADEILAAWEKLHAESIFTHEVINMRPYSYDDDDDRPLSPETLRAIEEAKRIVEAWRKLSEIAPIG